MKLSSKAARVLTAGALVAGLGTAGFSGVASASSVPTRTAGASVRVAADSPIVEVTKSNLETVKKMADTRPVVFLVTAPSWCGACKQLDPVIREMATKDGGKWVLAIMDEDKDGGAHSMFKRITGIPTAIGYAKGAEMSSPKRMIGWGGADTTRQWIDSVVKAYGPVTPGPAPTSTKPGPVPTSTKPGPVPTSTKPGPVPTSTKPGPVPTSTTPGPVPTSTTPAPTTPGPVPTSTTPAPDGAIVTVANAEEWKAVVELSKQRPVVVRVHLDDQLPMLSGENGKMAADLVTKDGGRWTLANVNLGALGAAGVAKLDIPFKGMPTMTVMKDGKFAGESLTGHSNEAEMRTWVDKNVGGR